MHQHDLTQLKPSIIWEYFQAICNIPHPSYYEKEMIGYLKQFAEKFKLEYTIDDVGNVLIKKPATIGMEKCKVVALQAHIDMVPQKNKESKHDFKTDPIKAYIDGDWVTAEDTTLGADNGIGVALMLAVLASDNLEHGPIEALFTMDEEVGMTGAFNITSDFLSADILLNLDTEQEGEFFVGCSGGQNTEVFFSFKDDNVPADEIAFQIKISGLQGGHSGVDIHLGRGNAIKITAQLLNELAKTYQFGLSSIDGGSIQHNAIPREANAVITVQKNDQENFLKTFDKISHEIIQAFNKTDPNLESQLEIANMPEKIISKTDQEKLLGAIEACPNGVVAMSTSIPGLVETSTNIAYIKTESQKVTIYSSQRSSIEASKKKIVAEIQKIFSDIGAIVEESVSYPGWAPNMDSEILKLSSEVYESVFSIKPSVTAVHAGLECGILGSKYPKLDMISFGPTIQFPHSPDERVEISSVQKFWDFFVVLLKNISE